MDKNLYNYNVSNIKIHIGSELRLPRNLQANAWPAVLVVQNLPTFSGSPSIIILTKACMHSNNNHNYRILRAHITPIRKERQKRFELSTYGAEVHRSSQLSYCRMVRTEVFTGYSSTSLSAESALFTYISISFNTYASIKNSITFMFQIFYIIHFMASHKTYIAINLPRIWAISWSGIRRSHPCMPSPWWGDVRL